MSASYVFQRTPPARAGREEVHPPQLVLETVGTAHSSNTWEVGTDNGEGNRDADSGALVINTSGRYFVEARLVNNAQSLVPVHSGTQASFFTTGTAPIQVPAKHLGEPLVAVAAGERIAQYWIIDDRLGRPSDATVLAVVFDTRGKPRLAIKHGEGDLATVITAKALAGRSISACHFVNGQKNQLEVTIDKRVETYALSWLAQVGKAHQRFVSAKPLPMHGRR